MSFVMNNVHLSMIWRDMFEYGACIMQQSLQWRLIGLGTHYKQRISDNKHDRHIHIHNARMKGNNVTWIRLAPS
jgi:hypothetical protein